MSRIGQLHLGIGTSSCCLVNQYSVLDLVVPLYHHHVSSVLCSLISLVNRSRERTMHITKTKSIVPKQVIFWYFMMLPQFIAKFVFGMEDFLYIHDKKNNANSIIKDITSASDLSFETSTKPRIVEFYSPYCVRVWSVHASFSNTYLLIVWLVLISVYSGSLHSIQKEIHRSCQRSL